VEYETFVQQVVTACNAGASGIAVGRAVWQEAVTLGKGERRAFLATTARERMQRLTALCTALAKPFTQVYQAQALFDWYKSY
jgi:tagatose-1,6-bisphosphate aldolase